MSNLEPIDDADLDLKDKFLGGGEKESPALAGIENKKESALPVPEKMPELRQEGAAEKEKAYTKILSKVQTQAAPADDAAVAADSLAVSGADSEEAKIETLIKVATAKGVVYAVKVARHWEDNYALDEFHDRLLADELHAALLQKGLIKEL
jgi:hypothetical protein